MKKAASLPYRTLNVLALAWTAYKRVTGYDKADLQRRTGLRIQSTAFPDNTARK